MAFLHRSWLRRDFALPTFEPAPLEFEPEADEPSADPASEADGFPQPRSEHRLQAEEQGATIDAAAELRQALFELRRSLG